ncbi:hypothetical protein VKS41_001647 [Umbelopsis sp. WA50703]
MPLAKLFGNKRKDRGGTSVHQISQPFQLPQDDEQFSQFGPMSSRAKSPSDILDFSGYPRLEPPFTKNYAAIQPKATARNGSPPAPQLAMPKPKHAIPPAKQVLMGEERDKTEIEHGGRPVYETSTHLPPGRNSASSGGYMGEREDSPELAESPENLSAHNHSEQSSPKEKSNSSAGWSQSPRKSLSTEEGKGFFAAKIRPSITQPTSVHTPPVFAPSSSMTVKNIAQELRPALQQPLPIAHDQQDTPNEPSRYSKATTVQDAIPSPSDEAVTETVVTGHGANDMNSFDEVALKNNPKMKATPQSPAELVDLRQQMSAIKLEREEWKKREHEHRQREQEMLDQINQTQAQLQIALSNGGFLAGTTDPRPDTPDEEVEIPGSSKPNQLGPASENGSMSDDREFYSLPPSRSRREREFSDYGEEYSDYSADEPVREYRRRQRTHRFDDGNDDDYYEDPPARRSRYHDIRPRLYEPEIEKRRRYHSYTPSSVDSDLSADYSPRFSGRYSSRHDDCDCYDCLADREHDLYYSVDSPEHVSVRSRSRASSHRYRSRSGSLSRNANRSDSRSRNRSRSGSRADSRAGSVSGSRSQSRSQNRSQASSRSQGHNSFRQSTPRRHSQYGPEVYYDEDMYVPHSKHKNHNRRTRSSGSIRKQYRGQHPSDIPYEEWPDMHEQYMPMPEPHFPIPPPPFHAMHPHPHPAMASHMSLPDLGPDPQHAMPLPPPSATGPAAGPRPRPSLNETGKEGPRGILRKPSGSLPNMQQRQSQPQHPPQHQPQQHAPQHGPFPMQHFGPPMMSPHGPFPPPGMGPRHPMAFPPPPHGMFPQGPPWHGGQQQPPPMHGPVSPGNARKSRKS